MLCTQAEILGWLYALLSTPEKYNDEVPFENSSKQKACCLFERKMSSPLQFLQMATNGNILFAPI